MTRGDIFRRAAIIATAMLALPGCGAEDPARQTKPFEIDGAWLYLGPSDVPHDLTISQQSMVYTDVAGNWSSTWTIKAYDNDLRHFQVVFGSGTGAYLPHGESMSGAYDVSGTLLTVQLGQDLASYPPLQGAGSCTSPVDGAPIADCRLYIKQN